MFAWRTKKFLPLWARTSGNMIAPPKGTRKRLLPPPLRRTRSHPANTNAYLSKSPKEVPPQGTIAKRPPSNRLKERSSKLSFSPDCARLDLERDQLPTLAKAVCGARGRNPICTVFSPIPRPRVPRTSFVHACGCPCSRMHSPLLEAPRTIFVHARSWIFGGPNHVKRPRQRCSQHRWT